MRTHIGKWMIFELFVKIQLKYCRDKLKPHKIKTAVFFNLNFIYYYKSTPFYKYIKNIIMINIEWKQIKSKKK